MNDTEKINLLLGCLWNLRKWAEDDYTSREAIRAEIDTTCETVGVDLEKWDNDYGNANVDLPDTAAQDSASKSNNPAVSG